MISVVIPTYERADLLPRAVRSVIAQTWQDWECIVVDDGSTDGTAAVLEALVAEDARVSYVRRGNGGQGAARNTGIARATGDLIAFLDSDDEWLPEKLARQAAALAVRPDADFCFTADLVAHPDGRVEERRYPGIAPDRLSWMKLASIGVSVPSSHVYRRASLDRVGPFDERRELIGLEDNEWSVRGWDLSGIYVDEPLTRYHVHAGQVTRQALGHQARGLQLILRERWRTIARSPQALLLRLAQLVWVRAKAFLPASLRDRVRASLAR